MLFFSLYSIIKIIHITKKSCKITFERKIPDGIRVKKIVIFLKEFQFRSSFPNLLLTEITALI